MIYGKIGSYKNTNDYVLDMAYELWDKSLPLI